MKRWARRNLPTVVLLAALILLAALALTAACSAFAASRQGFTCRSARQFCSLRFP